jgi:hypothetical protein
LVLLLDVFKLLEVAVVVPLLDHFFLVEAFLEIVEPLVGRVELVLDFDLHAV